MLTTLFLAATLVGDGAMPSTTYEPPVRLQAGDTFVGARRMYPSPVLHDVTGDGKLDLVLGDLPGNLTYHERTADGWGPEKKMLRADGKPLKFNNW